VSLIRQYRGLTQAQVQKRFGWAEGRLSKLESGSVQPKPATLRMLARLYGCEFNDLFGSPPEIGDAGLIGVLQLQRLLAQARQGRLHGAYQPDFVGGRRAA
jgi:transcriptional regulator with XRE-family HTH domain